ncbi:MAG: nuclear transport factor 2 family protein [Firmicutes bacterium]|nr:nuclear transport factor 2 family protein [Bacillota bacterium]
MDDFSVKEFLRGVTRQDAEALRAYFAADAAVYWHNSNECFTAEEYIRANCAYPGTWDGAVERVENAGERMIVVAKVWDKKSAYRVVSFLALEGGKIRRLDEYWGDVGEVPEWRREMGIGKTIEA